MWVDPEGASNEDPLVLMEEAIEEIEQQDRVILEYVENIQALESRIANDYYSGDDA